MQCRQQRLHRVVVDGPRNEGRVERHRLDLAVGTRGLRRALRPSAGVAHVDRDVLPLHFPRLLDAAHARGAIHFQDGGLVDEGGQPGVFGVAQSLGRWLQNPALPPDRVSLEGDREAVAPGDQRREIQLESRRLRSQIRRRERFAFRIDDADRSDILDPVVDLGSVSHHHDGRVVGIDGRPGCRLRLRGGDRAHLHPVGLHVVGSQSVESSIGHGVGHLVRGLDGERVPSGERSLGRLELLGRDRLGPDPLELTQELTESGIGDLGTHLGAGFEEADAFAARITRVGAVGPALLLPQNHE